MIFAAAAAPAISKVLAVEILKGAEPDAVVEAAALPPLPVPPHEPIKLPRMLQIYGGNGSPNRPVRSDGQPDFTFGLVKRPFLARDWVFKNGMYVCRDKIYWNAEALRGGSLLIRDVDAPWSFVVVSKDEARGWFLGEEDGTEALKQLDITRGELNQEKYKAQRKRHFWLKHIKRHPQDQPPHISDWWPDQPYAAYVQRRLDENEEERKKLDCRLVLRPENVITEAGASENLPKAIERDRRFNRPYR